MADPKLSMSADVYTKYPWLKMYYVDDLIANAQQAVDNAKFKSPTDLYSVPSFLTDCENGLKLLRSDRASKHYDDCEYDEELNNIEKNLERLIHKLREITLTEKCDVVEEIIRQKSLNVQRENLEMEKLQDLKLSE